MGTAGLKEMKRIYDPAVYPFPSNLGGKSKSDFGGSIWWWTSVRAATDPGMGACGVRSYARSLVAGGSASVYAYLFAHPPQTPSVPGTGPGSVIVPHAAEIPYVFGDVHALIPDNEKQLAVAMGAYWSSFGATGTPNHAGLPQWPLYAAGTDTVMRFDDAGGIHTQLALRKAACDFWDSRAAPSGTWPLDDEAADGA